MTAIKHLASASRVDFHYIGSDRRCSEGTGMHSVVNGRYPIGYLITYLCMSKISCALTGVVLCMWFYPVGSVSLACS